MRWQKLVGAVGAECSGVDVRDIEPAVLMEALARHQLLVLRSQRLDPDSFTEIARGLGELDSYPFAEPLEGYPHVVQVLKEPDDEANFGGAWHTDTAYLPRPPAATLLYALEVPATGGDTLFADMAGVFRRASPGFQAFLCGLRGHNTSRLVHDSGAGYASVAGQSVRLKASDVATEAEHPLVVERPGDRRLALFFSLIHTSHLCGMSRTESLPLLTQLHELVTAAENTSRLQWQPGTLAIWDNRSVQHYPLNDYPGQRREMHRIILRGDRPRGPATGSQG